MNPASRFFTSNLNLNRYIGPDSTHPAVTVIDGEFVSLYPYAGATGKEFTLTSVADTPLGNYNTWAECEDRIKSVGFLELEEKKTKFEAMICKYVPNFKQNFGSVY